ncbi:MAG TPA: hypothetical protein VF717_17280 [Pyrinomonadaceae bacterium]
MSKLSLSAFLILTLLLAFSLAAEPTRSAMSRAPKFSSVYTDLNRDCKSALTRKEEKEAEARGTDIPERCKGYGGYYIFVGYSATTSMLEISREGEDNSIGLGMFPLNYIDEKGKKIEWRMADGKPFAVIYRVSIYSDDVPSSEEMFDPKYKEGEKMRIRGLKGYEYIAGEIDAKTPDANLKARELADNAFLKGRADYEKR